MNLSWLQGWSLHSLILKNMELEKYFKVSMFPEFKIYPDAIGMAYYHRRKHYIGFDENKLAYLVDGFDHVFFHEIVHSTAIETKRFDRFIFNSHPEDAYNLEEQIAEVGAFILLSMFSDTSSWSPAATIQERFLTYCKTELALPWGEVERAVKYYLIDKDCPKLESTLQYYKHVVSQVTTVYEGQFNGRLQIQSEETANASKHNRDVRNFA